MTVRFLPSNRTRLPCELGERRPAATTTPALTSSPLNFSYSAIASGVGGVAALLWSPSFASTSTRISLSFSLDLIRRLFEDLIRILAAWAPQSLIHTSNDRGPFRHSGAPAARTHRLVLLRSGRRELSAPSAPCAYARVALSCSAQSSLSRAGRDRRAREVSATRVLDTVPDGDAVWLG